MVKTSLAFFAGAAVSAIAAFVAAGAPARLGALFTIMILTGAVLSFPRQAARLLIATADGVDSFRSTWSDHNSPPAVASRAPQFTAIQSDVIEALTAQGMKRKEARARVVAAGEASDFEQLFRKAVNA